jgi:hypothetical protein
VSNLFSQSVTPIIIPRGQCRRQGVNNHDEPNQQQLKQMQCQQDLDEEKKERHARYEEGIRGVVHADADTSG